jgi:tol-pal system protein YbgF
MKALKIGGLWVAASLFSGLLLPGAVLAQVDVVDATIEPLGVAVPAQVQTEPMAAAAAAAPAMVPAAAEEVGELFYQLQMLQEEIQLLRGLVEEQQNQISELKRQRLDDYMSLDKRLAELQDAPSQQAPLSASNTQTVPASPVVATEPQSMGAQPNGLKLGAPEDEKAIYKAAYALVKEQRFNDAKTAFGQFIKLYPSGQFTANAYYWQGELLLLEQNLAAARDSFVTLLGRFPEHNKVPDAMFKLAKVYHLQGQNAEAKKLLEQLISQYGDTGKSAVRFAKDYLQRNFP